LSLVVVFQVCAAVTPPDVFIIRVLNRFGLSLWAETDFEKLRSVLEKESVDDTSRAIVVLAEEMLQLLIIVIG
uniref:E3 ubiquitin-protein ligase n=1 Tax=Gongylonema pulchrum TaxID=637853 RepID=A0A183DDT9_9BILA